MEVARNMNRELRAASAGALIALNLLAGIEALRWWHVGYDKYGAEIMSLPIRWNSSSEPLHIMLLAAVPSALICLLSRSGLTHVWLLALAAYQLYFWIDHDLKWPYPACDRSGCETEDMFLVIAVVIAIIALLGVGVIQIFLLIAKAVGAAPRKS
jgi:hypothetical protein